VSDAETLLRQLLTEDIDFEVIPANPDITVEADIAHIDTILVAEDNNDVRRLAREVLAYQGYAVVEAVDGDDAVRRFMEHKDEIALVLLDVVMPGKNGKEVYEEIRKVRSDVKVLFTSGYNPDTVLTKGVTDEAINYVTKPWTPNQLLRKVREVLDK